MIVHAGLAKQPTTIVHSSNTTATQPGTHRRVRRAKFYFVRAGDTLSTIAVKTHVPIDRLLNLNPLVSPNSLQTGQRLRLRR